jgi:cystathionine beta-lyase/cystathionine gamma-synthase
MDPTPTGPLTMTKKPDDICPRIEPQPPMPAAPASPAIWPASVYACDSPETAQRLLEGTLPGYVYQRDGHPNADMLAARCGELHGADQAVVTASGMSALSAAVLSLLEAGDHVVASNQLYGRSLQLLLREVARLGIAATAVDVCRPDDVAAAWQPRTRLLVAETISNPLLRVCDLAKLAELAHERGGLFLVDNTFASPVLCRPMDRGADLVMESISKIINGHSDVMLGLLCGPSRHWGRVRDAVSAWGLASSPFDCWLALRGLATLHLRVERACSNASAAAEFLSRQAKVSGVRYPGLADHADHGLAARQFGGRFGWMITFDLAGGRPAAEAFIRSARNIPFCPSLGEVSTTLSHPESTSHRGMTAADRAKLGITGGTIRLSVGTESSEHVVAALGEGLAGVT